MLDLYYWPTPNGHKVTLFLEESSLPYRIIPINIGRGEQFQPDFLRVAPNNRIPAMVDPKPLGGGQPLALFESGAILLYLAEKTGRFLPPEVHGRANVLQWLFWQMAGLGPMAGQNHHFSQYAPEKIPYAIDRYVKETARLHKVLDTHLQGREYIDHDYSIADMAIYPWIVPYERQGQDLNNTPNLQSWFKRVAARPATARAYAKGEGLTPPQPVMDAEAKKHLFGQK